MKPESERPRRLQPARPNRWKQIAQEIRTLKKIPRQVLWDDGRHFAISGPCGNTIYDRWRLVGEPLPGRVRG